MVTGKWLALIFLLSLYQHIPVAFAQGHRPGAFSIRAKKSKYKPACDLVEPYRWPVISSEAKNHTYPQRLDSLKDEIKKFSTQMGSCLNRKPIGKTEEKWTKNRNRNMIDVLLKSRDLNSYCKLVQKIFVNSKFSIEKDDPAEHCQYANCGEGAEVGACLAYDLGFDPDKILVCQNTEHAWTLVPESKTSRGYCLLDRWNSFRCGVTRVETARPQATPSGLTMRAVPDAFLIPGKVEFSFANAVCNPLNIHIQRFM